MEQPKPSLNILELSQITPSPSPPAEFSLPLTFFDLPYFTIPPTERILFYSFPADAPHTSDSILQKLKHSLSLTLSHFFPLAGNVVWPDHSPDPFILYKPGDSVSLTVAQTDAAHFHRLSSDHIRKANESHFLVPQFQPSDTTGAAPIMCLQITLFPDVGLSIGIATNHTAVDGKTSTTFLKSWGSICTQESESNLPTLDFDRTAAKDPDGLHKLYLKYREIFLFRLSNLGQRFRLAPKKAVPDDVAYGTFELTRADIDNLRTTVVASSSSTSTRRRLSSFVLTYAHVSTCVVKAQGLDPKSKVALLFIVDWRLRLGGSLVGANYFGNGVGGCGMILEAGELMGENGVGVVSNQLSDVITEMEEKVKKNEQFELMDEFYARLFSAKQIGKTLTVAGSPRFGIYDMNFGWGRCRKVEMTAMMPGDTFCMGDSRNGNGGVEVGIALPRDAMNLFSSLFSKCC